MHLCGEPLLSEVVIEEIVGCVTSLTRVFFFFFFQKTSFMLFLNKFDIFEKKVLKVSASNVGQICQFYLYYITAVCNLAVLRFRPDSCL